MASMNSYQKCFAAFDERELELLISGLPSIDVLDLKWNTELVGFTKTSQTIIWFWSVLCSLNQEELALFVQFVTGTSKVPAGGFHIARYQWPSEISNT